MTRFFGNRKMVILICLFVSLCGIGSTWAYFTHSRMAENAFHIGNNKIEVTEEYEPPKTLEVGENVFRKRIQVENTGTIPCFVRVFVDFSNHEIRERSQISSDGTNYVSAEAYAENLPEGWVMLRKEEDALLGGFYYYTEILEAGEKTVPLCERVKCTFESAEEIQPFDILVSAESIQAKNRFGDDFPGLDAFQQAWTEYLERR